MKVWRWYCFVHELGLLTMQTGESPPTKCSGLAHFVWPEVGLCIFRGQPVLSVYTDNSDTPPIDTVSSWLRYVRGGIS